MNINDITVTAENQLSNNKIVLKINEFSTDLSYKDKKISSYLILDTSFDSLNINNKFMSPDKQLILESKIEFDTEAHYAKLYEGNFSFEEMISHIKTCKSRKDFLQNLFELPRL